MDAENKIIYQLNDNGFRFTVYSNRFEISGNSGIPVTLHAKELVRVDKYIAKKEEYIPDFVVVFRKLADGEVEKLEFALSKTGVADKLYLALKKIIPEV